MPDNVLQIGPEILSIVTWTIVLIAASLAFAIRHRARTGPGTAGHRPPEDEGESERVSPDGYIDTFANIVEEAGGGLPLMGWIVMVAVWLMWLLYMIFNWQPR
ncbi:MAG TPA: hypothetical protein VIL06_01230 [Coriobacteriia bacterium]